VLLDDVMPAFDGWFDGNAKSPGWMVP
jgi:hypothetical protein